MPSEGDVASTCAVWMISCAIDRRRLVFCISLLGIAGISLQVSLPWLAQASYFSLKRLVSEFRVMIEHPSLQRRENSDEGLLTAFTCPNKYTLAAEVYWNSTSPYSPLLTHHCSPAMSPWRPHESLVRGTLPDLEEKNEDRSATRRDLSQSCVEIDQGTDARHRL